MKKRILRSFHWSSESIEPIQKHAAYVSLVWQLVLACCLPSRYFLIQSQQWKHKNITVTLFWYLYCWLVPKATNLWFRRICHAGVLDQVQRFSGVFSLAIYITCHMITVEELRGNNESPGVENFQIKSVNFGQNKKVGSTIS